MSRFTYDLTNATGLVTNQPVLVIGAHLDTNSAQFTTNYFQAYDVPLTNGLNRITLRATDLAGNSTVTNIAVTLDYSGDTTPPAIAVTWPQTNTPIASSVFTLIGTVDDPTASVVVTGPDGQPKVAVVERTGRFFASDPLLTDWVNAFAIIATDACGNSRTNQFTVLKSDVTVSFTPLSTEQLSQYPSIVTVTGSISDLYCDVWVNGCQATVNEDGSWEAEGVVLSNRNGSAQMEIAVYPAGSDPAQASSARLNTIISMPSVVRPVGYRDDVTFDTDEPGKFSRTAHATWELGVGGSWSEVYWGLFNQGEDWPTEYLPGRLWQNTSFHYHRAEGSGGKSDLDNETETRMELVAKSSPQNGEWRLIRITASASTCSDPVESAGFGDPDTPQLASSIQFQGELMTPTATNEYVGEAFVLAQAGSSQSVSYSVDGAPNITVQMKTEDIPLTIKANDALQPPPDVVSVGQRMDLRCVWDAPSVVVSPPITNYQWKVASYAISNYVTDDYLGIVYTNFCTTNQSVEFYWVDGGTKEVTCKVKAGGHEMVAKAQFTVERPVAKIIPWTNGVQITVDTDWDDPGVALHWGKQLRNAVEFSYETDTGGTYRWCQLTWPSTSWVKIDGQWWRSQGYGLDNAFPFPDTDGHNRAYDAPAQGLSQGSLVLRNDSFKTFLMYIPSAGGIYVPLRMIEWGWKGEAGLVDDTWVLLSSPDEGWVHPNDVNATYYPEWTNNFKRFNYVLTTNSVPEP